MIWSSKNRGAEVSRAVLAILAAALVTACGGGGGGSSSGGGTPTAASKLFVADSGNAAIGSLANSNPSPGAMPVDRVISGANTGLSGNIGGLVLDATNDRLYVANGLSVLAINNAGTANGDVTPSRVVTSISSGNLNSLFLDATNDVLYVGEADGVRVFNGASTATNASPSRTITGDFGAYPYYIFGIAVDVSRDVLYVLNSAANSPLYAVNVFDHASTISGNVTPDRVIELNSQITNCGLFLDAANNRLYVSAAGGQIFAFNDASTVSGSATPDRVITLPSPTMTKIAVDTVNDRLYAVGPYAGYIVSNISTASGTVAATQVTASSGGSWTAVAVSP